MSGPGLSPYLPSSYYNSAGQLSVTQTTAQQVATVVQNDAQSLPPAQQAAFLAMVQNSTSLAPGADGTAPADLNASLDRMEQAAGGAAAFMTLAQNPEELAALLIEATFSQQKNAIQQETIESQLQIANADAQAAEDTAGAAATMSGALDNLVCSVVAAAVQLVAAGVSIGGAGSTLKELSGDLDADPNAAANTAKASMLDDADDADDVEPSGNFSTQRSNDDECVGLDGSDDDDVNLDDANAADSGGDDSDDPVANAQDKIKGDRNFHVNMERIKAKSTLWQSVSQGGNAIGGMIQAVGSYLNAEGQATNQTDQAQGQVDAAQQQQALQNYNIAVGIVQSLQSFVEAMQQALSGIANAEAGMSQAVSNARAGF